MNDFKQDMAKIQTLVGDAFTATGSLVALSDGAQMNPQKLQQSLEKTMAEFEKSTLALRTLCETYSPGVGEYGHRPRLSQQEVAGTAKALGYNWLHIRLRTLLPHCRYQTPTWLIDTIGRVLDDYEAEGNKLPYFRRALLVIDEHSQIDGRHAFDQDNKGWKAVCNALKGRVIPDDDQYTLGLALLSTQSTENVCHLTIMDLSDAADFFAFHSGDYANGSIYDGISF